jgi:hypothetical protein
MKVMFIVIPFFILVQPSESSVNIKSTGMRRFMVSPLEPIALHRFVDYGGLHPFENSNYSTASTTVVKQSYKNLYTRRRRILGGKQKKEAVLSLVKPLRIYMDTTSLRKVPTKYGNKVDFLIKYVLPLATNFWSEALNVIPAQNSLHIDRTWCPFDSSAAFTETGMADVDLIVFVTANGKECYTNLQYDSVLASSYSCYWDQYDRPIAGNLDICLDRLDDITDQDLTISATNVKEKLRTTMASGITSQRQPVANISDVLCKVATNLSSTRPQHDEENTTDNNNFISCETSTNNNDTIPANSSNDEENALPSSSSSLSNETHRIETIQKKTTDVIVHELAHLLGMTFYDMLHYRDWSTGLPLTPPPKVESIVCLGNGTIKDIAMPSSKVLQYVSRQDGDSYYEVVTPTVVQVVRNQFNCQSLTGAPLENQPTNPSNCIEAHWEEQYFATEALSSVSDGIPQMVTPLTLALLKDTGWYWPNFDAVNVSSFGLGAGCEFITEKCIKDGIIPSYGKDAFCNIEIGQTASESGTNTVELGLGCDPSHTQVSRCDLIDYSMPAGTGLTPPPMQFQYFTNPVSFFNN